MKNKKIALTIAGSDPSGGAGVQADMKSFSFLGVHGVTVIVCLTAQNTQQVTRVYKVPVEVIEHQIDVLFDVFSIAAVKTGMLYDEEIVRCVSRKISQYGMKPVVDPVMVATSGDVLSDSTFIPSLKKDILPKTFLLTANIPETEKLLGVSIHSLDEMEDACRRLRSLGPRYVLVKGGHLQSDDASDVFYNGKTCSVLSLPRIPKKTFHGVGCTLSALITGYLARGEPVFEAVQKAKGVTWAMIHEGYQLGQGACVLDHSPRVSADASLIFPTREHVAVWSAVKTAVEKLVSFLPDEYIPEVGVNIGYALPGARGRDEVCAVDGRIVKTMTGASCCGVVGFGASKHVASIILTAMSFDERVRCAVNLRYSQAHLARCRQAGLRIGSFDRRNEPSTAGSTMEWGIHAVITRLGFVPDIIYDVGAVGKEPMMRILGETPEDVLRKIQRVVKRNS